MKLLCILWDLGCLIGTFRVIASSKGDGAVIIGALIAFVLIAVLPTCYCFREKDDSSKRHQPKSSSHGESKTNRKQPSYPTNGLVSKAYRNETYYKRLKRLCNPENFMIDYDKDKVDIANNLYSKILNTKSDDKSTIIELIEEAEENLHINFLDEVELTRLIDKLNPKNYMNPYDAEKVSLANELYDKITCSDVNLTIYLHIKEQAKPLTDYLELVRKTQQEENWKRQVAARRKQEEAECNLTMAIIGLIAVALVVAVAIVVFLTK